MSKIRIAFIMTGIAYGGASKSLLYLLKSLANHKNIETFVFAQDSNAPEIKKGIVENCSKLQIIPFPHLNCNQAYKSSSKNFQNIVKGNYNYIVREICELNIDIVHVNSTTLAYLLSEIKHYNPQIKTVTHLREVLRNPKSDEMAKYLIEKIVSYSDFNIAISDNELVPFKELIVGSVIPNPYDFACQKGDSELNLNNKRIKDEIVLGMMGAFNPSKGHRWFIETVKILKIQIPYLKIKGVILGVKHSNTKLKYYVKKLLGIDYLNNIEKYIKKNKLEDNIFLMPASNSIIPFLNTLDIYVRPSVAGDPWGRDIIEAMAMKKPVIATGTSDFFVKDGITGFLVPPRDPKVMADKLLALINNPRKRKEFGENGYKIVKEMCDLELYGDKIVSIYNKLLGRD